jgi:hypothetical protein
VVSFAVRGHPHQQFARKAMDGFSNRDLYSFGSRLYFRRENAPIDQSTSLVGVLFARPEVDVVSKEILTSLRYFDARSSDRAWFFFAGYVTKGALDWVSKDEKTGGWALYDFALSRILFARVSDDIDWYFSSEEFNSVRSRFEEESEWRYSGGVDLLLVNMKRGEPSDEDEWFFDFRSTLVLHLDNVKDAKVAGSIGILFEKIFKYSESLDANDPVGGLSDYLGLRTAGTSVIKAILSFLPHDLGAEFQKVASLAIRDMSRKT